MYGRYNYSASANINHIISDIIAMLTGETDVNNLSAGCDKTNSFILTTYNAAGWTVHDRAVHSLGTCTISNATPAVVTKASHGLTADTPVCFTTTGALPSPLVANTIYYVSATGLVAGSFQISATIGGASINTTTAGSGTHTLRSGKMAVLKSPLLDDGATYKYVLFDGITAVTHLTMMLYESWNATTHVGGNSVYDVGTTHHQRITIGVAASMLIGASARYMIMQSTVAAGVGASHANEWTGIFERSRLSPWDTVANGYPPTVQTNGYSLAYGSDYMVRTGGSPITGSHTPRYKNPAGGDVLSGSAVPSFVSAALIGGTPNYANGIIDGDVTNHYSGIIAKKIPDGLGGFYCPMNEIHFRCPYYQFLGGSISSVCDVWLGPSYPNNLDEVVYNGKTYIFWNNTNHASYPLVESSNIGILKG